MVDTNGFIEEVEIGESSFDYIDIVSQLGVLRGSDFDGEDLGLDFEEVLNIVFLEFEGCGLFAVERVSKLNYWDLLAFVVLDQWLFGFGLLFPDGF